MRNILNRLKSNMERISMAVMLLAIVTAITGTAVMAWGPSSRQTFTIEKPASYITFNSITNNPNYGDERNFVIAKDAANTQAGGWSDNVTVQDGKEYLVRMYVHNNAGANLNLVANNTRVMANVPNNTAKNIRIDGYISANNANPQKIWDEVNFTSDKEFNLTYITGSTRYYNNVNPNPGFTLSDSIVTNSGAHIGYDKMDGNLPGCFQYSGIVTFKVKATTKKTPNFTINKQVRVSGTNEAWKENTTAKPGETVEYRVIYTNTGETRQNNVAVRDKMDAKLKYVNGSSSLKNATNPNGVKISDKIIEKNGINIGHYESKSNAIVYYRATVPQAKDLTCGVNTFKNVATIDTDNGSKSDEASVTVKRDCGKITVCELSTKKIISIKDNEFDKTKHSKDMKDCAESKVKVCELTTKKIIEIKGKEFDGSKHSTNMDDCQQAPVTPVGELPHTGPTAMIAVMSVLVAAGMGVAYYWQHRQAQRNKMVEEFGAHIAAPKTKLLEAHLTKKAKK